MLIKDLVREYSASKFDMHRKDCLYEILYRRLYNYYLDALENGISYKELYEMIMYEDIILLAKEHEELSDKPDKSVLEKSTVIDTHSNCKMFLNILKEVNQNLELRMALMENRSLKMINKNTTLD